MTDIIGTALLDYYNGNYTQDIITATNISEEDTLPLPYLFRNYTTMPAIEQTALQLAKGKVLDIGCGAGSHSLYLQDKGLDVTAIDLSEGAIKVAKKRGVKKAHITKLLEFKNQQFDTILLLMNGTGIFGTLKNVNTYLQHLKTLLKKSGTILIDSSDLQYMYPQESTTKNTSTAIWVPADRYYGELVFTMSYKNQYSTPFNWLYLDEQLFKTIANANGFNFTTIKKGSHYDYLAALTIAECTLLQ